MHRRGGCRRAVRDHPATLLRGLRGPRGRCIGSRIRRPLAPKLLLGHHCLLSSLTIRGWEASPTRNSLPTSLSAPGTGCRSRGDWRRFGPSPVDGSESAGASPVDRSPPFGDACRSRDRVFRPRCARVDGLRRCRSGRRAARRHRGDDGSASGRRGRPRAPRRRTTVRDRLPPRRLGRRHAARDLRRSDRLDELAFELPLAGGENPCGSVSPPTSPECSGATSSKRSGCRLCRPARGPVDHQELRGYLTGSIDLVLRFSGSRLAIVDYKTNRLAPAGDTEPVALPARGPRRGDGSRPLSASGDHLHSGTSSIPQVATPRLRPGGGFRRSSLPVPAWHERSVTSERLG